MEITFKRKLDELHRIALPADLCHMLDLYTGDILSIDVQDGKIILTPLTNIPFVK